jgi:hypothetical protein
MRPRTEWVPGVKRPGREADGVNEWIYISATPLRRHGLNRERFTFIVYGQRVNGFHGKTAIFLRILWDVNTDFFLY